jgi:hypothetical protein
MIDILDKLFPKDLYHSYVIEGNPQIIASKLLDFLEFRGEVESQSSDVLCQTYEAFTMDDSVIVKEWHSRSGITNGKKVCILAANFINREAEQTLLKIIEEPSVNTHFFIVVPDSSALLETIISRTHVIKINNQNDKEIYKTVTTFISSSPKERIDMIVSIIKENKDEENSGKLRAYAVVFVNEIESIFYQKFKKDKNNKQTIFILGELQKARVYLSTPGASVKMILEHLALIIS